VRAIAGAINKGSAEQQKRDQRNEPRHCERPLANQKL
jgi:hypothetical protein